MPTSPTSPGSATVIDTNAMPWEGCPNEKIGRPIFRKFLIDEPETGTGFASRATRRAS